MKLPETWLSDPAEIERHSMAAIDAEAERPERFSDAEWAVVRRMIHTSADFELAERALFSSGAVDTGVAALRDGAVVVCDTWMAKAGMPARRLTPFGARVECLINDARVEKKAIEASVTRSMAAVDLALETLRPVIWVIGNAPTALLRLLQRLEDGAPTPQLIIGMPVGFINAAESKALLVEHAPCAFITIQGRKGGSALAASVLNALAILALATQGANREHGGG